MTGLVKIEPSNKNISARKKLRDWIWSIDCTKQSFLMDSQNSKKYVIIITSANMYKKNVTNPQI